MVPFTYIRIQTSTNFIIVVILPLFLSKWPLSYGPFIFWNSFYLAFFCEMGKKATSPFGEIDQSFRCWPWDENFSIYFRYRRKKSSSTIMSYYSRGGGSSYGSSRGNRKTLSKSNFLTTDGVSQVHTAILAEATETVFSMISNHSRWGHYGLVHPWSKISILNHRWSPVDLK